MNVLRGGLCGLPFCVICVYCPPWSRACVPAASASRLRADSGRQFLLEYLM